MENEKLTVPEKEHKEDFEWLEKQENQEDIETLAKSQGKTIQQWKEDYKKEVLRHDFLLTKEVKISSADPLEEPQENEIVEKIVKHIIKKEEVTKDFFNILWQDQLNRKDLKVNEIEIKAEDRQEDHKEICSRPIKFCVKSNSKEDVQKNEQQAEEELQNKEKRILLISDIFEIIENLQAAREAIFCTSFDEAGRKRIQDLNLICDDKLDLIELKKLISEYRIEKLKDQ